MRVFGAVIWLAVLLGCAIHLADRWRAGVNLSTDLLALLPEQGGDDVTSRASQAAAKALSREVIFAFGHQDPIVAQRAAATFAGDLETSGLVAEIDDGASGASFETLGELLFAHRAGLLSREDRHSLLAGQSEEIYQRALAQIFSPISGVDSRVLRADPFQLFPRYVAGFLSQGGQRPLPAHAPRYGPDGTAYAVVSARFADEPYALSFQNRFVSWFEDWRAAYEGPGVENAPPLEVLRAGAVFYAHAGAKQGLDEARLIGGATVVGLVVLVLVAFGGLQPIWLSLLSIASGLVAALAINLLLFEELHYVAVIFGAGLIGVSVDYAFHYCCERFGQDASPSQRLRNVLPGATFGVVTSIIGFLTLAWAPFPGLRQVALFSVVGLAVAYVTVVIWFPILDRSKDRPAKRSLIAAATYPGRLWRMPGHRIQRRAILGAFLAALAFGGSVFSFSDDIRDFQALSPDLKEQERAIREIAGLAPGLQFFVVGGADNEDILQREEALGDRLAPLRAAGAVGAVLAVSGFVPSAARQAENRALVAEHLGPDLRRRLEVDTGLSFSAEGAPPAATPLTLNAFRAVAPMALTERLLPNLGPDAAAHIVMVQGVTDRAAIRSATEGMPGVTFVDPVTDLNVLFEDYRNMALLLLAVSVLLMAPVLLWRYGWRDTGRVLAAPVASVIATPFLVAATGGSFSFFNAMALILVFAVGIDYALFCREAAADRRGVTSLANGLAATTTVLSFGLLAFSGIPAVHSFGLTVFLGIVVAFMLAPLAERTDGTEGHLGGSA